MVIKNDKSEYLYGLFEKSKETNNIENNSYFDQFYDIVGNYYEFLKEEKNIDKIKAFYNNIIENDKIKENRKKQALKFYIYNEEMTLSQYKTRLGFLLIIFWIFI